MGTMDAPRDAADAAWASVNLALPPEAIGPLLADPELLLRLNPCLEFERLERRPDGHLSFAAGNESNGCRIDTEARVLYRPDGNEVTLSYSTGIKRDARLRLETVPGGARLTISESYATPDAGETERRLAEVDRSLVPWTAALRRHLERNARYGWIPGYRWWSTRLWPSMTPGQRRVTWLILWTTAIEFAVFIAVLGIYLTARS